MNLNKTNLKTKLYKILAIIIGTLIGFISIQLCIYLNLAIFGFNIYVIFSPIIAGFVETFISQKLTNESSGAISSIIIFIFTNLIGFILSTEPIKLNLSSIGGLLLTIQSLIPLASNFIIILVIFAITYIFGRVGELVAKILNKDTEDNSSTNLITDIDDLGILVLNNKPNVPIKEYHGMVFAEKIIHLDNQEKQLESLNSYMKQQKNKEQEIYNLAKKQIIHKLQEEAIKMNANTIIDIEIEYINCNESIPPDMLIASYGTAITIDEKYL